MLNITCISCRYGFHDNHVEIIQQPLAGGVGGMKCPCTGDCASNRRSSDNLDALAMLITAQKQFDKGE